MTELLHITERSLWEAARAAGTYEMSTRGRTLQEEGFIHCSLRGQLVAVAAFLYGGGKGGGPGKGHGELVVLVIDSDRLSVPLRYEVPAPGADAFPHLYGPLPVEAVTQVIPWQDGYALDWSDATWLNPPAHAVTDGAELIVTTRERTDFWRTTSYGFVRDDGHALLTELSAGSAVEVTFLADFDTLYDQAGVMVRTDEENWIKAGVEMTDGAPHVGAVATRGVSDWSMAPVPEWAGRPVTVRASRSGDAVTVRARAGDEPWRMIRLTPLEPGAKALAGPFCCSPQRAGLRVRFTRFVVGPADRQLHG
jgi:uncharacterized protein